MGYDSKVDTLLHIKRVAELLTEASVELIKRANVHDNSKLDSPEKELFDEYTPKLKDCTYGSDEYNGFLKELGVALTHHYENNTHHPEHYDRWWCNMCGMDKKASETWVNGGGTRFCLDCSGGHAIYETSFQEQDYKAGIKGFDLFDLVEMFFDWKAATERHDTGNIFKSIEINKERFKLSDQLCDIMINTANRLGYDKPKI